VHASARARFSTQRFETLDIVVATDKADGDGRTKLSAATAVTIYCVRKPILQVMMISVCYTAGSPTCSSRRFDQFRISSYIAVHYDQDLVTHDPDALSLSDNIPMLHLVTNGNNPHFAQPLQGPSRPPQPPLAIVAFACNSSASRWQPQCPWFSHAVKTSRLLQQP
jgi:hypothetical protein